MGCRVETGESLGKPALTKVETYQLPSALFIRVLMRQQSRVTAVKLPELAYVRVMLNSP